MNTVTPTASADDATRTATPRRGILHGMTWLVWRRHRTAFWIGIACAVVGCAVFAYHRAGVMELADSPGTKTTGQAYEDLAQRFQNQYRWLFDNTRSFLGYLPAVAAIFLGAPLIAAEQEHGTVKLVTTQSASRGRWIAVKLSLPLLMVLLCTTALSAAFTWLWEPAHELVDGGDWLHTGIFDATGPVPVASALFLTVCAVAIGMFVRRVRPGMAITFVFTVAFGMLWDRVVPRLATPRVLTYPFSGDFPPMPADSVQVDNWVGTADGRLYGFGTCVGDAHPDACRAQKGIVNNVVEYFSYDQMGGMQWRAAGILLALTVAVAALIVWWARRRPL
ncbi:ABC transporter permease subunit [Streptomyces sp. MST-110588]|uniref:ABC transporter permease subunit n=1 Tax=Streptomyces sp. MST-110588 TaxID=2833628 RepID=UPI001F5CED40|nr:ABC transporter permease subunit [Streptomyces sp. MST-110588]UNO41550.1 ABC transporter permease subunit [Streptomyces sp. MST-110588]